MIIEAAIWCFLASSTVLVGTWISLKFSPSPKTVGLIMGFADGGRLTGLMVVLGFAVAAMLGAVG